MATKQTARLAVERGVETHVAAVGGFDQARILAPTRPLPGLPGVGFGVEHRFSCDLERDAVVAHGETDARRPVVGADRVLGPGTGGAPGRPAPPAAGLNTSLAAQATEVLRSGQVNRVAAGAAPRPVG